MPIQFSIRGAVFIESAAADAVCICTTIYEIIPLAPPPLRMCIQARNTTLLAGANNACTAVQKRHKTCKIELLIDRHNPQAETPGPRLSHEFVVKHG